MGVHYIPQRDQEINSWAANFSQRIEADPGLYGVTQSDAAYIKGYVDAFDAALEVANNPDTRTKPKIAAKDGARAAMLHVIRGYAQQIRINRGISDQGKIALGLRIPDTGRTPLAAPVTAPILTIIGSQPGEQTLRYADMNTPNSRAKPWGACGLQVFALVSNTPPAGPEEARFRKLVSRQPFAISFEAADKGKPAHYFARWQTHHGRVGPWSAMTSMIVV